MAQFFLKNVERTEEFGKLLARLLPEYAFPALLMIGDLGSGKTALTSAIVNNMANGGDAEVSSPSFTICNQYPTNPPTVHCDLYRCKGAMPDEVLEMAEAGDVFWIVEWAEFLAAEDRPQEFLDISFKIVNYSRLLNVTAMGRKATGLVKALAEQWCD